jgi:ATP-dependent RNA helicase MSS116, mitochondrial
MSVTGLSSSSSSSKAFFPNLHRSIPLRSSSHDYNSYEEEENETVSRKRRPVRSRTTRLIRRKSTTEKITSRTAETRRRHEQALKDPTLLTEVKFSDRSDIHPATKRAIVEILGLRSMTEIQAKTYDQVLAGRDVLGRAHTGTGKTLAYLLPSLERLLSSSLDEYRPGRDVGVLIIAPTRELVIQIAEQAQCVLSFHTDIHMEACDMYGGTSMHRDIRRLSGKSLPALIVATPGRLMDHLEQTRIRSRKFSDIMGETKIIVLDEVDQLVEGFSKELNRVFSYLPRAEKRQTLLFSATMPRKVRSYMNNQLKITNATEVDCVDRSEVIKSMVNTRIQQSYIILESMECYISTLVAIVMDAMKSENNKVLVFFPASNLVRFFARFFNEGLGIAVLELHSRMSQSSRSRASNNFRESSRSIMFTSDVSARGEF